MSQGLVKFLPVSLSDELFDCVEGFHGASIVPENEHPNPRFRYHTYSNTVVGTLDDPDVETTLRMAFERYLRRLRDNTPAEGKPQLFWRFRKGQHIMLESNGKKRDPKVKLYTRLVVPLCNLVMCDLCYHTEGEPHAAHCENIVRRE